MANARFIQYMPEVDAYRASLNSLSERWNLLTLLGQMSNIGMDMTETREGFQRLTDRLLERLGNETLNKLTSEMEAKAQVAVDVVIRNLFERTADIGFLATDDDVRSYIQNLADLGDDEEGRVQRNRLRESMVARFQEYVAKYSVYYNIVLLSPKGQVLAQLDKNSQVTFSRDPLIQQALTTNRDYVESYRHSDLAPDMGKSLIYAYRVRETNESSSPILGVLCLLFRFENEMEGVFANLIADGDWIEITLLDQEGLVIASSDPYHIPPGAKLRKVLDRPYDVLRFGGREYLAKTCATHGYEGYTGLGWYGHVMVPLDSAFKHTEETAPARVDQRLMEEVVRASTLFSGDLVDIPRQADRIQRDLDVTVWNGNVQIANTKSGDNSFSKSLLNEISRTGGRTKQVFEESIANLNQTVISSFLDDAAFHAMLAVDIMDRNLYERANDCRWWALTSRFRSLLAQPTLDQEDRHTITDILCYINNLYTVYTNLMVYDRSGSIVALSNAEERHLVGTRLVEPWVSETLALRNSQEYSVSDFKPSHLYGGRHTYVYGAAITGRAQEVLGGIAVVFDSEPQFSAMLRDALPKDAQGDVIQGCFGVFADRSKTVIASTSDRFPIGSVLPLADRFFALGNGSGDSGIIELDDHYYVVGVRMSAGYREFKISDNYRNDVVALVFVAIGEVKSAAEYHSTSQPYVYQYPRIQGSEETLEVSTFLVGGRLFGMESRSILCSLNGQEVTPIVGSSPRYLGMISFQRQPIPVVSLRSCLGGEDYYDRENDCIILAHMNDQDGSEAYLMGLVIDRVMDSPEIPRRCLQSFDQVMRSGEGLTRYVVQPEPGSERSEMLSIIDVDAIYRAVLKAVPEPRLLTGELLPKG